MTLAHQPKHSHGAPKLSDVMGTLEYYLVTKAPYQLPDGARELLVTYLPWIDFLILVLLAPAIVLALHTPTGVGLTMVALVVRVALLVLALPGLFARKQAGWNFAFYGVVFGLVFSIFNYDLLGGLIWATLQSYLLFQIRSYYK